MKEHLRSPWFAFGLILIWRLVLLIFTAQPIPANDAFFFDGAVINWMQHGHYFNPSLSEVFPISGHEVFAAYPPLYQVVVWLWMPVFGTSALSAMALHLALFSVSGFLALKIIRSFFPAGSSYTLAVLLLLGITFGERPDDLAQVFGLCSLWLLARKINGTSHGFKTEAGIVLALLLTLYTSPIVGAFYFGVGFLTRVAAWLLAGCKISCSAFVIVVVAFTGITFFIAKAYPILWHGFLENARVGSAVGNNFADAFRVPTANEILKLVRNAPVYLAAAVWLPFLLARRNRPMIAPGDAAWLSLAIGIATMGLILLAASMVLLAPTYVAYVLFAQIILAAGLLALTGKYFAGHSRWLNAVMLGCCLLVSVRAAGMTTWGAVCAHYNSYFRTHELLRVEFQPFVESNEPIIVSSVFLYSAAEFGVKNPIHSDWYFNRSLGTAGVDFKSIVDLRPPRLVVTQFDYYRGFVPLLEQLGQHPELVEILVRDTSSVRTPDSIPAFQRVLQHISWAPVIVDLKWKTPMP